LTNEDAQLARVGHQTDDRQRKVSPEQS